MMPDLATPEPRTHVLEAFRHRAPAVLLYQWDMVPAVRDAVDARLGGPGWRDSLTVFLHGTDFPLPRRAERPDGTYVDAKTMLDETPVDNAIATVEGVSGRRLAGHDLR